MATWLPLRESDRLTWLQNFALKLNTYVGTAGIVAADVTAVNFYRDIFLWTINRTDQVRTVSQDLTEWKRLLTDGPIGTPIGAVPTAPTYPAVPMGTPVAGIFPLIIALAERIRNTAGYTTAIGEDLGIVPPVGGAPLGDPVFELVALPGSEVRVNWVKSSADGLLVESQRAAEVAWTVLGTDNNSPYLDARPPLAAGQPEVRRYRGRYIVNDEPVGNYSAVASVTTIP
ncbi:MAG: hypothetical protein U0S12_00700 [Fimbriimonadales bacterium]